MKCIHKYTMSSVSVIFLYNTRCTYYKSWIDDETVSRIKISSHLIKDRNINPSRKGAGKNFILFLTNLNPYQVHSDLSFITR